MKKHKQLNTYRSILAWIALGVLIIVLPLVVITLHRPDTIKAEWWDGSWMYRQKVPVTNNTTQENNVYISITLDSSDTTKFQTDCGDLRFTKVNGQLLPYYISSGCGSASTVVHVLLDTLPAGAQTFYYYYGNPSAPNATETKDFATVASNYTVGSIGTQELTPGPSVWWKFDEGTDNTCSGGINDACDSTANKHDGALSGPTWQAEDKCVTGKCLFFDGNNDNVSFGDIASLEFANGKDFTISVWVRSSLAATTTVIAKKAATTAGNSGYMLNVTTAGAVVFYAADGTNQYQLNTGNSAITAGIWYHIIVVYDDDSTTNTDIYINGIKKSATPTGTLSSVGDVGVNTRLVKIGSESDDQAYFPGFIDDTKIYPYARSASQILVDYNAGAVALGATKRDEFLSDGLVGYWKMDEATGSAVTDYSGNNNTGTLTSAQETGIGEAAGTTTTLVNSGSSSLSSSDDAYNSMILEINGGTDCSISAGTQRVISDYTGSTKTITVGNAFSAETDNCGYVIKHQDGGIFGNSIQFDGENDYVTLGSVYTPTNTHITFSAWVNVNSLSASQQGIIGKTQGSLYDFGIVVLSTGAIRVTTRNSSAGVYACDSATSLISTGGWYYISGTIVDNGGSATYNVFVNGNLVKTCTDLASIDDSGNNFRIGSMNNANYTSGKIDEIRVYNRALSASEINRLYTWAPGPVGYWTLDENVSGEGKTLFDRSGNANNLTTHDGANNGGMNCAATGKFGGGCEFDGNDDYVSNPSVTSVLPNTGDITVMAWIYRNTDTTDDPIMNISGDTDGMTNYLLYIDDTDDIRLAWEYNASGTWEITDSSVLPTISKSWIHVAAVRNVGANTVTYYLNGSQFGTSYSYTNDPTGGSLTPDFYIGSNSTTGSTTNMFDGSIDDVKVYNYIRTPSQIVEDMNAGHPAPGSPVGSQAVYWKFDEQKGSTANDSVNHSNGTITNASWATQSSCKYNACLQFDAAGENVSIATANDNYVDFNGSEVFSGSAWIYVTAMPTSTAADKDAIIVKWDDTNNQANYRLYVENDDTDTTGNVAVQIYDESASQAITATGILDSIAQNTWYHVSFTFNGGTIGTAGDLKLYVDGKFVAQNAANASFLGLEDKASDFTVGEYDTNDAESGNTAFTGYVDEVKVYPSLLTDDQIKMDYNAGASLNLGTGTNEASLLSDGAGNPPIRYWKFDENTGSTVTDSSGNNGTDGVFVGITQTSTSGWTPGKYGSALYFDGAAGLGQDDQIDTNYTAHPTVMTIEAWIYPRSLGEGSLGRIFVTPDFRMYMQSTNRITFQHDFSGGSAEWTTANNTIPFNTWTHVALTYDNTSATNDPIFYINGVKQTLAVDTNKTGTANANTGDWDIGNNSSYSRTFDGKIDEFKIYTYIRTPAQIAYDYNRGSPLYHYSFDECQGETLHDTGSGGKNGTIVVGGTDTTYTSLGTCSSGTSTEAWNGGTTGKYNASFGFSGDEYAYISGANMPTDDFTISAWMYASGAVDSYYILMVGDGSGNDELTLQTNSSDQARVIVNGTSYNGVTTLQSDRWYHIAATRRGSAVTLYVNGVEDGTGTNSSTLSYGSCALLIGVDDDSATCDRSTLNQYWNGLIDDVRVYNYALSADQIKTVMNGGAAVRWGP